MQPPSKIIQIFFMEVASNAVGSEGQKVKALKAINFIKKRI